MNIDSKFDGASNSCAGINYWVQEILIWSRRDLDMAFEDVHWYVCVRYVCTVMYVRFYFSVSWVVLLCPQICNIYIPRRFLFYSLRILIIIINFMMLYLQPDIRFSSLCSYQLWIANGEIFHCYTQYRSVLLCFPLTPTPPVHIYEYFGHLGLW